MELLTRIYRINCKYPAQLFSDVKYSLSLIQLNSFRFVSFWLDGLKAGRENTPRLISKAVEDPCGGSRIIGFMFLRNARFRETEGKRSLSDLRECGRVGGGPRLGA